MTRNFKKSKLLPSASGSFYLADPPTFYLRAHQTCLTGAKSRNGATNDSSGSLTTEENHDSLTLMASRVPSSSYANAKIASCCFDLMSSNFCMAR